jgi:hypothetical protein
MAPAVVLWLLFPCAQGKAGFWRKWLVGTKRTQNVSDTCSERGPNVVKKAKVFFDRFRKLAAAAGLLCCVCCFHAHSRAYDFERKSAAEPFQPKAEPNRTVSTKKRNQKHLKNILTGSEKRKRRGSRLALSAGLDAAGYAAFVM